jgi:hypothetical protein
MSEARTFVEGLRAKMETALTAFDARLPTDPQVKSVTTKKGKGSISLTPLEPQQEPANTVALTAALVSRWPMTNLLDVPKETELRVHFTEALRTVGAGEVLDADVLPAALPLWPRHQRRPEAHL